MNTLTSLIIGLFVGLRVLIMGVIIYYAAKYALMFASAHLISLVLLMSATMFLALMDIYRVAQDRLSTYNKRVNF